jgi:hypothetical protein
MHQAQVQYTVTFQDFEPSGDPSSVPSIEPSRTPSNLPSLTPSELPSSLPSLEPSLSPSAAPSFIPSLDPSAGPSLSPSAVPSFDPSAGPSLSPSAVPSFIPSSNPSSVPSTIHFKHTICTYNVKQIVNIYITYYLIKVAASSLLTVLERLASQRTTANVLHYYTVLIKDLIENTALEFKNSAQHSNGNTNNT